MPTGVEIEPFARWVADLSSIPGPFEKVQVLGLAIGCWKCGGTTVCIVGFLGGGRGGSFYDMVLADDDLRLSVAGRLLGDDRQRYRVGTVRKRFSRTIGGYQVANGCYRCDALQGNFFLFQEELPEAAAEDDLAGLVDLGTYEVPLAIWRAIRRGT